MTDVTANDEPGDEIVDDLVVDLPLDELSHEHRASMAVSEDGSLCGLLKNEIRPVGHHEHRTPRQAHQGCLAKANRGDIDTANPMPPFTKSSPL